MPDGSNRLFPRLKKRGSIEAFYSVMGGATTITFPRLKKRGSIEARYRQRERCRERVISTFEKTWLH